MTRIGYARAAQNDNEFERQEQALAAAGCSAIRKETLVASTIGPDTELTAILNFLRKGDILVVFSLDRLARSLADLVKIVRKLEKSGAHLLALDERIDSRELPAGALLLLIKGLARFETANRREKQLVGVRRAQREGVYLGRKPTIDQKEIKRRLGAGQGPTQIAREMQISRASVYAAKRTQRR